MQALEELKKIYSDFNDLIKNINNIEELKNLEIDFLGRKHGKLTLVLKKIKDLSVEEKKIFGQESNKIKKSIIELIEEKKEFFQENNEDFFDYSLPAKKINRGYKHPISQFIEDIEDIFSDLNFDIVESDEVDDEDHNFNHLNIPPFHPAREMQDTFWIKNLEKMVARSQTSNMQIHWMENNKPPFRIIAPGKVFRKDSDATHSPIFHQMEALVIDKNISLSNLKHTLHLALKKLISPKVQLRFRTSYFPFTEPSLEVDSSCVICDGKDKNCRVCKGTGFLELGGAGIVHPNVLKNVGLDPKEWNGFAFGFGLERQIMIKHQIDNIKRFYENDVRFLSQF